MRKRIKYLCVHFWRPRDTCRGFGDKYTAMRCNNCHDRRMGGVWFFKSLGFE